MDAVGASSPNVDEITDLEETEIQNSQMSREMQDQEILKVNDLVAYFSSQGSNQASVAEVVENKAETTSPIITQPAHDDETMQLISLLGDETPAKQTDQTVENHIKHLAQCVETHAKCMVHSVETHPRIHPKDLGALLRDDVYAEEIIEEPHSGSQGFDEELVGAAASVPSACNTEDDTMHQSDDEQSEFEVAGEIEQKNVRHMANKLAACLEHVKKQELKLQNEIKDCKNYEKLFIKSQQRIRIEEAKLKQIKEKGKKRAAKLSMAVGGLKALE